MKKLFQYLQKAEDGIMIGTFAVMVLASFAQVLNRNIFHMGISWFEELARYCMVYMALIAAEAGLRDGTQISITALTDKLKGGTKKAVQIFAKLVVVVFSATVFVTSFKLLWMQNVSHQMSPGLRIPMLIPYFAITLSFAIITVVQTGMLAEIIFSKANDCEEENK